MEKPLLLLPFVHGIDTVALSSALAFAQEADAALLLVSLIRLPKGSRRRSIRAEAIGQAHDFFEVMSHKAKRAGVTIKCMQFSTRQIASSIQAIAQEMACVGILLFVQDSTGIFLEMDEIKQLLEQPVQQVYLFRLASRKTQFSRASVSLVRWLQRFLKYFFLFLLVTTPMLALVLLSSCESLYS